jgi:hypothetical protein
VQVRAGAPAGAPGGAEPLTGRHLIADPHAPAREVAVQRDVAVAERDFDHIAVPLVPAWRAGGDHASRLRGAHGERMEDPDVDPGVPAPGIVAER